MAYGTSPAMYVGTDASGGYQVDTVLTRMAFHTPQPQSVFRAFLSLRSALGKNAGDTVYRNRWGNISTAGAAVAESATIPTDRSSVLGQATATVTEFGNAMSVHSKLIDLALQDPQDDLNVILRNDAMKAYDSYIYSNVFFNGALKYVGTATGGGEFTTNATATATNTSVFNSYHLRQMVKKLSSLNAPRFANGRYRAILHLDAADEIYEDGDWQNVQLYKDQYNGIVDGYLGTLWGCDMFTSNNAITTVGSSGEVFVFGELYGSEDLVMEPEIRSNYALAKQMGAAADFGRKIELGWYGMSAFGKIWDVSGTTSHSCHWTTA
jgi:N4-gp56 family major capsid protein